MGGARLCRALFRAERGERREHLCLGSVSRRGSRCSRLPLYRIISSGLEFPLAGGSQGSTESRPTSVKATAWAATQLLEPLERFQKNCSRSWVGRDSVEPCFERSEASAASIFVLGRVSTKMLAVLAPPPAAVRARRSLAPPCQ